MVQTSRGVLRFGGAARRQRGRVGLCQGNVDGVVELGDVHHQHPALLGDDEEAGCAVHSKLVAECAVGTDLGAAVAGGVEDEGKILLMRVEPLPGVAGEVVLVEDAALVGEDVAAELLAERG